jgi:replicative DNA helicase
MPPNDPQAELGVIGSILLDSSRFDAVARLKPEHFHHQGRAAIWSAIRAVCERNGSVDAITLIDHLRQRGDYEKAGGAAAIAEAAQSVPHGMHASHWARIVERHAKFRAIIAAGVAMVQDGYAAEGDPDDAVDRCEAGLSKINTGPGDTDPVSAWDATREAVEQIDTIIERRRSLGVPTGLSSIDTHHGGLFPSELIVLAARPAIGKSSLALQIAFHNARRGRMVYVASMEMSRTEIVTRELCAESGVSTHKIRTGQITQEHQAAIAKVTGDVGGAKLWIHDHQSLSVYDIRRATRRLSRDGLRLIVVDYLQLIRPEDRRDPREQQVAKMARGFKALAVEMGVPVLLACQLNREGAKVRPQLHHLRESGSIEQDANVVWFLHPEKDETTRTDVALIVAKNRNGQTGDIGLCWAPEETRFYAPGERGYTEFSDFAT